MLWKAPQHMASIFYILLSSVGFSQVLNEDVIFLINEVVTEQQLSPYTLVVRKNYKFAVQLRGLIRPSDSPIIYRLFSLGTDSPTGSSLPIAGRLRRPVTAC